VRVNPIKERVIEGEKMPAEYLKSLPPVDAATRPFWEGAKRHELMVCICLSCGRAYWPAIQCSCDNPDMEWVKASGRGEIFTFTLVHQAPPNWAAEVPYNVTWIKLEEGPILMSRVVECKNEDLRIGLPVQAVFDDVSPEFTLVYFKPAVRQKSRKR
jgi:uncharacterized protein